MDEKQIQILEDYVKGNEASDKAHDEYRKKESKYQSVVAAYLILSFAAFGGYNINNGHKSKPFFQSSEWIQYKQAGSTLAYLEDHRTTLSQTEIPNITYDRETLVPSLNEIMTLDQSKLQTLDGLISDLKEDIKNYYQETIKKDILRLREQRKADAEQRKTEREQNRAKLIEERNNRTRPSMEKIRNLTNPPRRGR